MVIFGVNLRVRFSDFGKKIKKNWDPYCGNLEFNLMGFWDESGLYTGCR